MPTDPLSTTPPALPCPPALWPRFSALLDTALDLPPEARAAWLAALPPEQLELRPWLAAVLDGDAALRSTHDHLDRPRLTSTSGTESNDDFAPGQRVGPWELLAPLGSGGMGAVWRARRADGAYQRGVALKLPHAHLLAGSLKARFARERDILAALAHPNVARFYDAGLSADGQPWLALECVEGETITRYCESRALGMAARIALLQQVAAALQAAHARLIVHRDLKPANVLVTAAGEVKLLDFGIAKLLGGDGSGEQEGGALTQAGGRLATPDYAAPEQLAGGAITVATDVFALGAMAYELLAGAKPFAARTGLAALLAGRGAAEAPPASTRARRALQAALRGDLDAILAKALAPDPAQRYVSVEGFADDLARHLAHRPIRARRITRRQRAGKFLRRNRAPLGFAALLLLVLAGGIAGVLWQAQRATTAAARATQIKNFLVSVFAAGDPRTGSQNPQRAAAMIEVLDRASARLATDFAGDGPTRLELLEIVGDLYGRYQQRATAERIVRERAALARALHGEASREYLRAQLSLVWLAQTDARHDEARSLLAALDPLITRAGLDGSAQRASWWLYQSQILRGVAGARPQRIDLLRRAAAQFAAVEPAAIGRASALGNLGTAYLDDQQFPQALEAYEQWLAVLRERHPDNLSERGLAYARSAVVLEQLGRAAEAGPRYAEAERLLRESSGTGGRTYWYAAALQLHSWHRQGRRLEADAGFERLLTYLPADWQGASYDAEVLLRYGDALVAEGRPLAALPHLRRAVAIFTQRPQNESDRRAGELALGEALLAAGDLAAAEAPLRAARQASLARDRPGDDLRLRTETAWGEWQFRRGQTAAAAASWQAVRAVAPATLASLKARAGLARVALARGERQAALAETAALLADWPRATGLRDVRLLVRLQRLRADALLASGEPAAAQALEDEAAAASARYDDAGSATVQRRVLRRP